MTFSSFWVEEYADGAFERPGAEPRDALIRFTTGSNWFRALSQWARQNSLPTYYVDNCWIRVLADRGLITVFVNQANPDATLSSGEFLDLPNDLYILVAEEF